MDKALTAVRDLKAFWYLEKPVEPRAFTILVGRAIRYKRSLQKTDELRVELRVITLTGGMRSSDETAEVTVALAVTGQQSQMKTALKCYLSTDNTL